MFYYKGKILSLINLSINNAKVKNVIKINYFEIIPYYRASCGCQDVLLHFINICKKALDDGNVCMAFLEDLSKAFDCFPYRLLICKLRAYGLSVNPCELLKSYFCERKQRVKLGDKYSDWLGLSKGVRKVH